MVTRTDILRSVFFCIFLINLCSLAISLQDENFLESDHIAAEFFRGMGFKGKVKEDYHPVPILSKDFTNKGQTDEFNTGGLRFKKSQYFVPGWADSRWRYRKNITIDSSNVNADLTNFPVYIDLYDTDLPQDAQASGNDIFFTDIQGNLLDHEIELYERVYNSSHAHLVAWVKVNISSTQDTILSMYYGNPIAENQENPIAVWDENYVGVWHLGEESGNAQDSTSYATSGGITGGVTQNLMGQLGRGYDFDGASGSTVDFDNPIDGHLDFGLGNYTISFWYNVDQSTGNYQMPLYKGGSSNGISGYEFETSFAAETLSFYSGDGTQTYSCGWADISYDEWHYVAGINDRLADYLRIYQDSVNIGNTDISSLGNVDSSYHLVLSPSTYPFDGMIDEVRLSKSIRSSAWMQTEYNNQKDPTTFYSVSTKESYGADEYWPLPELKYRKNITVLATQVSGSGNLDDFPVLIDLFDKDLHSTDKVQTNGEDIAFVDATGTKLDYELELFDQSYNSTHAHLVAWVRVPSLSGISNTTISMYYGNKVIYNHENIERVWNDNYKGVWHLSESSGSGSYIRDSTNNNHDGDPTGTEFLETGKIGAARNFPGTTNQYIEMDGSDIFDGDGFFTFSFWLYPNYSSDLVWEQSGEDRIFYKENSATLPRIYRYDWMTAGKGAFQVDLHFEGSTCFASVEISRQNWNYITYSYNGSYLNTYVNGSLQTPHDIGADNLISDNSTFQFGVYSTAFNGSLDEFRYSAVDKTSNWIVTEYTNQHDPKNFYVVENEEEYRYWYKDASFNYRKDILIDHTKVKGESQVLTLRPNGVGHVTFLSVSGATDNYEAVDEVTYDTSTYVYRIQSGAYWGVDYYQTENAPAISSSTINSVTIKFRGIKNAGLGVEGRTQIYTYSQYINGDATTLGSSYANVYSQEYLTNPYTGEAWTWTEINDMEIGVGLKGFMVADEGRVTQLWAEVNYTKTEDLSNFPILVDITSNDFKSGKIQPDAADLLFTDVNGTKIFHEIEYFSQNSIQGHLIAWVRVNELYCNEDTFISMYYCNEEIKSQEFPNGVWGDDYAGVWHLSESSGDAKDSTEYGTHGTLQSGATQGVTGIIDTSYDFDGNNEGVRIGNPSDGHLDFGTNSFTISFWINIDQSTGTYQIPLYKGGTTSSSEGYEVETNTDATNLELGISDGSTRVKNQFPITFDNWIYFTGMINRITDTLHIYKNGIEVGTGNDISSVGNIDNAYTMSFSQTSNPFDGFLDEIRLSNLIRSKGWIATEYSNQENPSTFYSIGSEVVFDNTPPELIDFGIDDPGTGVGKFWADVTDSTSDVSSVTIKINTTEYAMSYNNTHWFYQLSVNWTDYIEFQIINASDVWGNFLTTPSSVKNYTFIYDNTYPTVDEWDYFDEQGPYGTFKANISDSWGIIDTVIVNITELNSNPRNDLWAIMQPSPSGHMNDTIAMAAGSTFWYVIVVNDTSGNRFNSSARPDVIPNYNHAPEVSNLTLSHDPNLELLPIYSNCTLYLDYDFYDADNNTEGGTEIRWYKNGVLQSAYNDDKEVPESALIRDDQWNATVKPKDGQDFGDTQNTTTIIVQNTPPTVSNVVISPVNPDTTSDLSVSYSYSDHDGDLENTGIQIIQWYKDSVLQGIYDNSTTIPSTITSKGEEWYYKISVNDGTNYSNTITSSSVVIANKKPEASGLTTSPTTPYTGDDLKANWTFTDVDGDSQEGYYIEWYQGVTHQPTYDNLTILPSSATSKIQVWYFKLTVNDGTDNSTVYTSPEVEIFNTPPMASGLTLTSNPKTDDDLQADWTFDDVDGDSESTSWIIQWFKNGILQPDQNDSKIILSSLTSKGEIWNYTLRVHDGTNYSIQYNSSITMILNSPPTASGLTITSNPTTSDDLIASWTFNDVDGDSENSSWIIHWYKDNTLVSAYDNQTTLLSSGTSKGEVWNYTVQVYDGEDYSIQYNSITTTIINTPPTTSGLSITPTTPYTSNDLEANWTFEDVDGDSQINYYIEWYKGMTHQPAYNNLVILPSTATTKNQAWYFKLIVNDGTDNSTVYSSPSVDILNTPPTASGLTLTSNPTTSNDLQADWTFDDVDGDSESTSWILRWYKNGILQPAQNDSKTIDSSLTSKGEIWNYTVRVYDGSDYSIQYNSSTTMILNSLPTASGLTITNNPTTDDDLTASWTFNDMDGDSENNSWIIHWYKENTLVAVYDNQTTVPSSATIKGEEWNYTVQVYDGEDYSIQYNSSITIILNSAPTISGQPSFNKTSGVTTDDTLNITYTFNDADSDAEVTAVRIVYWYKDGSYNATKDNDTILDSSETKPGEWYYYIIRVSDGIGYSQNYTSEPVSIGGGQTNDPPVAENLTLTLNPTTLDNLVANYDYYDNDSDEEAGSQIRWYKDGILQSHLNDTKTVQASETAKGEEWYFTVRPKDGLEFGTLVQSSNVTILNTPPSASGLTITINPTTTDNLGADWSFSDVDGDSENTSWIIRWFKDNGLVTAYDNQTTVPSSATSKGEKWNYTIQVFDGENYSIQYNSSITTILNTIPTASGLDLTNNPLTTDSLIANYTYADADNDLESSAWEIRWYKDNVLQPGLNDTKTITPGNTSKNEFWYYTLRVHDGESYSILSISPSQKILNTAPTLTGVSITINPYTTTDLEGSWTFNDIDNDDESTTRIIKWYKNNVFQAPWDNQTTVPASATSKGETWNYTVKVYDGKDYSIQYNSSTVTILNTKPTVSSLTITASPKTSDDLIANWLYTDIDGDPENSSWLIRWFKNGVVQPSLNDTKIVKASNTTKGENWYYTIRVFDGDNYSDIQTLTPNIVIVNTRPSASDLTITNNPRTTDNLVLDYNYTDIDGDTETTSWVIKWYRDGGQMPIYDNLKTISWTDTAKNEIWHYTLQVHDGENLSIEYTSPQVIILNSAPSASSVMFNPTSPTTLDNLSVIYIWNDVDSSDTEENTMIRWYRNNVLNPTYNDLKTVYNGLIVKDDLWNVSVRVSDGTDYGIWVNISIFIANSAPSIMTDSAQIYKPPSGLYTTNTLIANWNDYDPDGDSITDYKITWENRSTGVGSFTPINGLENLTEVPSSYTAKGQDWRFKMQVYDDTDWSEEATSFLVTILNSEPRVENISLSGGLTTTNNITLTYDYYDADGDSENTKIEWKIVHLGSLNTTQGTTTLSSTAFTAGDMVWVVITPDDNDPITGFPTGQPVDSSTLTGSEMMIQVGNTAPLIDTNLGFPEILSDHPNGTTIYTAITPIYVNYSALVFDIDSGESAPVFDVGFELNDDVQYATVTKNIGAQYRWYKYNSLTEQWELQLELTTAYVSAFYLNKDDQWKVSIRPRDQYGYYGIWENSTLITIGNSYPLINGFTWLQQNPTTNDDLEYGVWYEFDYFDWDNDSINMSQTIIYWFKNDQLIPGARNSTTLFHQNFMKGDQIYIVIRPFDSINWALRNFTSPTIVIANSPPSIDSLILFPTIIQGNEVLYLNWSYVDPDGDPEQKDLKKISWYKNGEFQTVLTNWQSIPLIYTSDGELWYAELEVYDGSDYGSMNSCEIYIKSVSILFIFDDQTSQVDPAVRTTEFFVENEDIIITYNYHNFSKDLDSSTIQWFTDYGDGTWIERQEYFGYETIPYLFTNPGEKWKCQITPIYGIYIWAKVNSSPIWIESRPIIHSYPEEIVIVENNTEGYYTLIVSTTDVRNEISSVEFNLNDSNIGTLYAKPSENGTWRTNYQISADAFKDYMNKNIEGQIKVISIVEYYEQHFEIYTTFNFTFVVQDLVAPRVVKTYFVGNEEINPTIITFYAEVQEYGSGIDDVVLHYYFEPSSENPLNNGGSGSSIFQVELETHMDLYNETSTSSVYFVTVPFLQNKTNWRVIYRISTSDNEGNENPQAFNILRDDPDSLDRNVVAYKPEGIDPTLVMIIIGVILLIAFSGSIVYVKFIRKPELVGLDKDLVLAKMDEITNEEIMNSLDAHTIGLVVSFFDQRHGPIPIITIPAILRDNFTKLVDLSDRSFSGTGFSDDFGSEILSSYDFVLAHGLRTSVLSYGFALERPEARGGQENLTLNMLVHQDIFPLIDSFKEEIKEKVHDIHLKMDKSPKEKELIRKAVINLRIFASNIILSYERIYETTELIKEE